LKKGVKLTKSATRSHACASMQTCLFWHVVTQLFARWGGHGSLKALQVLGLGLGWL
jgi:hypothetical protein